MLLWKYIFVQIYCIKIGSYITLVVCCVLNLSFAFDPDGINGYDTQRQKLLGVNRKQLGISLIGQNTVY